MSARMQIAVSMM